VLNGLLVKSSVAGAQILEDIAVRSATGKYCAPIEAKLCLWSGTKFHPDDLRTCSLTGLSIHIQFVANNGNSCLQALVDILDGIKRTTDRPELWESIAGRVATILDGGRCRVEAALLSPDKKRLALSIEVKTLLGFRIRNAGLIYEIGDAAVIGQIVQGRRTSASR
jgi:hypothetical protein